MFHKHNNFVVTPKSPLEVNRFDQNQ